MKIGRLIVGALAALGLVLAVYAGRLAAADPCCAVVKIDLKTRWVTVRETATGTTYVCEAPDKDDAALKALRLGDVLEIDVKKMTKVVAGNAPQSTAQAATACGGWNGPRNTSTRPTATTPPKPKD